MAEPTTIEVLNCSVDFERLLQVEKDKKYKNLTRYLDSYFSDSMIIQILSEYQLWRDDRSRDGQFVIRGVHTLQEAANEA